MRLLHPSSPAVASLFCIAFSACSPASVIPDSSEMVLTSDDFSDNALIPAEYTCDGTDTRPTIRIAGVPAETKSLAIIVQDTDAPSGEFIHWTAWNIDPGTTVIDESDVLGNAAQGNNGAGQPQYKGPCPPTGTHHYIFTLYAVNKMLDLPAGSTVDQLRSALTGNVITQTHLTGLYARNAAMPSSTGQQSSTTEQKTEPGSTIDPGY